MTVLNAVNHFLDQDNIVHVDGKFQYPEKAQKLWIVFADI